MIEISPNPKYLGRQDDHYAFAYEITITNRMDFPVKLLNRHWIITHGNGYIEEVRGEGVVGEKPRLEPGTIIHLYQWRPDPYPQRFHVRKL